MKNKVSENDLPKDWELLDQERGTRFEEELARELPCNHILKGIDVTAVAKKDARDDYLFEIIHPRHKYADVHLTWSVETDPEWPSTELYEDFKEWKKTIESDELY